MHPMRLSARARRLLGPVCALALAVTGPAAAQPSAKHLPRVGVVAWEACGSADLTAPSGPFLQGLRELGQMPGRTFVLECRSADGAYAGQLKAARDVAAIPVDVIVADNEPAAHAARAATTTIPIVSIISGDPVASGLARSLAAPGGNVTGVSYYATELTAKRLELLIDLLPRLEALAVLANPDVAYMPFEQDTERAAHRFGISATIYPVRQESDLDAAFAKIAADRAEAVFVLPDVVLAAASPRIAALALQHGLPSMAWGSWFTDSGILMAYSTDYVALTHRLAYLVDRVLHGASPAELPIEQPATYQLSINLRTARTLGVDVPPGLLLLATKVVE
jgi:putative ABC transport system substrate-binding protein